MKQTVRFAVAKYVPDLHRMEPRNLGIVLWSEGGAVASRFLGENPGAKFRSPPLVEKESRHAYRQWIAYWRHYLKADQISDRAGKMVNRTEPEFFDALLAKSKEQFRLADAGQFAHKLASGELTDAVNDLFVRLVEVPGIQHSEQQDLKAECDKLLNSVTLPAVPVSLQHNFPMPSTVFGVFRTFNLDYCWADGAKPQAAFQRVLLTRHQSYDSNALMFQSLTQDGKLRKETCGALINGNQPIDNEGRAAIDILNKLVTVIDVSKPTATQQIQEIAAKLAA